MSAQCSRHETSARSCAALHFRRQAFSVEEKRAFHACLQRLRQALEGKKDVASEHVPPPPRGPPPASEALSGPDGSAAAASYRGRLLHGPSPSRGLSTAAPEDIDVDRVVFACPANAVGNMAICYWV